jgi:O-antigen biosynthesis protein
VEPVLADAGSHVRLLVLRYPPVLEFPPSLPTRISVERMVVVANQVPVEVDGTDRRYTISDCDRSAKDLFGVEPVWAPQGPLVRAAIADDVAADRLTSFDLSGILPADSWELPRRRFRSDRPVIGRLSRDDALKWPSEEETLLQAYPDDDAYDVRVMGGPKAIRRVLGRVPGRWLVYPQNAIGPREFLHQIDFFVYFHHPVLREAFGRVVLEALAAGCVTILPEHFRPAFGDAAVYCTPAEVRDVVNRLYSDGDAYRAQSRRAVEAVRTRFSAAAYRRAICDLAPSSLEPALR